MKFYNYERLYLAARGDPTLIISLFFRDKNNEGPNFIINESVLRDENIPIRDRAEYLGICSLRQYGDYRQRGIIDLQLDRVPPWIPMQVIQQNPLLTTTSTTILFNKEK